MNYYKILKTKIEKIQHFNTTKNVDMNFKHFNLKDVMKHPGFLKKHQIELSYLKGAFFLIKFSIWFSFNHFIKNLFGTLRIR